MKLKLIALMFYVVGFIPIIQAEVMTPCLTMEQTQAQYNQKQANAVTVKDTASQQLQTYYQQLATYWQQKDKDNQQIAKDAQQKAKDAQQACKDAQQWETDKVLCARTAALNCTVTDKYDELDIFIQVLIPLLGDRCNDVSLELKRIHTNRSGGGNGTNPGGHGNISGFDNPGYLIAR